MSERERQRIGPLRLQDADEATTARRAMLAGLNQSLAMRAGNYIKAIGDGRSSALIHQALDRVEAELDSVTRELAQTDEQIRLTTMKRPAAEEVQRVWREVDKNREYMTDEERPELPGSLVEEVEIVEKNVASMRLSPNAGGQAQKY